MTVSIDIPAKIITIDYIGISSADSEAYRGRALSELAILKEQMEFRGLEQYQRNVTLEKGIFLNCEIIFDLAVATLVIGAESKQTVDEYACFCNSYGIVAGRILALKDEVEEPDTVDDHYTDDTSYAADIIICQKAGSGQPKIIETREFKTAAGKTKEFLRTTENNSFWISEVFYNVPFTDHFKHAPGELVLVLIMPLVDFRPELAGVHAYGMQYKEKQGSWSPEVNRRQIMGLESPQAQLTTLYDASTGITGLLSLDADVWANPNEKFCPFRILPIPLESCLSGYK